MFGQCNGLYPDPTGDLDDQTEDLKGLVASKNLLKFNVMPPFAVSTIISKLFSIKSQSSFIRGIIVEQVAGSSSESI